MEIYILVRDRESYTIKRLCEIKGVTISFNTEDLIKEALEKNVNCSKIVIISENTWISHVEILNYVLIKTNFVATDCELITRNSEHFDFLNDPNIVYYNNFNCNKFKVRTKFPNITIAPYQHQLF